MCALLASAHATGEVNAERSSSLPADQPRLVHSILCCVAERVQLGRISTCLSRVSMPRDLRMASKHLKQRSAPHCE